MLISPHAQRAHIDSNTEDDVRICKGLVPGLLPPYPTSSLSHPESILVKRIAGLFDEEPEPDELETLVRCIEKLRCVQDVWAYPNFETNDFCAPMGFSCQIPLTIPFRDDLFSTVEKFRVMVAVEVEWDLNKDRLREVLMKCVPETSPMPPTIFDRVGSGWAPSLGERGCSIGLYHMEELLPFGDRHTRHFLVCHTSLPEQTLLALQEFDAAEWWRNQQNMGEVERLERFEEPTKTKFATKMGDVFSNREGVNHNLRDVAVENALRLIVLVGRAAGMQFQEEIRKWDDSADGVLEDPIQGQVYKHGAYRVMAATPDVLNQAQSGDYTTIARALKWWPKGAPIHASTIIPKALVRVPDRLQEMFQGEQFEGLEDFPLGLVLFYIREHIIQAEGNVDKFVTLLDGHRFFTHPETIHPNLVTDYNTFRVEPAKGTVGWFSGCTPTQANQDFVYGNTEFFRGVLSARSPMLGFEVHKPHFVVPSDELAKKRREGNPEAARVASQGGRAWLPPGGAFPVVFPPRRIEPSQETRDKFLFRTAMMNSMPEQLLHAATQGLTKEELIRLDADPSDSESVQLRPVDGMVFLSRKAMLDPGYVAA